jgi:DNA-binding response OmpR family regulator
MNVMPDDPTNQQHEIIVPDLPEFLETAARQTWPIEREKLEGPQSFRVALGRETIQLGNVEFRILLFLASRPYHPFTRRAIAEAVSTNLDPVTAASVDEHISSLRDQLGILYDYVQTVPYIGYRFKA